MIINPIELAISKEFNEKFECNKVENRKNINALQRKVRENAKRESCLFCGREFDGFCNSHTIPDFILRNIAVDGKIRTMNSILNIKLYDEEKGIRNAGTFRQICKKCDGEVFKIYEEELALKNVITDRMMYAIAMKNYLKMIDKRYLEIERNNLTFQIDSIREVKDADLQEYLDAFEKTKRYYKLNKKHKYRMIVDKLLDYRVPIAFQSTVALIMDLKGNIINDVYCAERSYRVEELHICVFPLSQNTRVLMFVNRDYKHYDSLTKNQMEKFSLNELLSVINYIIFLYSEDVYLGCDLSEDTLKQLFPVCKISLPKIYQNNYFDKSKSEIDKILRRDYDLRKRKDIPNLLSEKYKIVIENNI